MIENSPLIIKAFIVAFIVMAIWATMLDKMIFDFIRISLSSLNDFWKKPIFDCPICMVPYYGGIAYRIIWGNGTKEAIIVILVAMGINTVIVKMWPPED